MSRRLLLLLCLVSQLAYASSYRAVDPNRSSPGRDTKASRSHQGRDVRPERSETLRYQGKTHNRASDPRRTNFGRDIRKPTREEEVIGIPQ